MSPRSRTNLSEMTIDSKSEMGNNSLQPTQEQPEPLNDQNSDNSEENQENEESFFNHDNTIVPVRSILKILVFPGFKPNALSSLL